jgi:uncharacterized protein YunC (DUF1805 family)
MPVMSKTKSSATPESIIIDGVEFRPVTADKPNGKRAVVVVDRGWIFAGDVHEANGRILLKRAVHVRGWTSIGFDGMLEDPKSTNVTLKKVTDVDIPAGSEIYRVPVSDDWGL